MGETPMLLLMQDYRWLQFAILAAVCAASINIFGKIGMTGIDSDLSTAVRSIEERTLRRLLNVFLEHEPLSHLERRSATISSSI